MKKGLIFLILISTGFWASGVLATGTVDINTATLAQLDTIINVGPKTAQKIIDARPFSSVNDLAKVKGIGSGKTLQEIIAQGLACVNCATFDVPLTPPTSPVPTPITYPSGVVINEILPSPQGADEIDEWIELYNSNNFEVDLSDWQVQDTAGTTATYTTPKNTKILASGFLVLKRPETKIMLNNDEDGINLLTPDNKIIDSITFSKAPLGQSFNRTSSGYQWSTTLTPGSTDILQTPSTRTSARSGSSDLSKTQKSVKNDGVATLSQSLDSNQVNNILNPWFLFFTVLGTTIILAIIVLLIKFKLNNHVRT